MAAQRLIAILIALLVVSTLLAVLAPMQEPEEETTTTTTEPSRAEAAPAPGDTVERRLEIDPDRRTLELEAEVGDRLQLIVASDQLRQVRIDPLGLLRSADRAAPARFDIILTEPGLVTVNSADLADPIATFEVRQDDLEGPDRERPDGQPGNDRPPEGETEGKTEGETEPSPAGGPRDEASA